MSFDFAQVQAPFRMQPGLRRLAAGTAALTPNEPGSRHLREKIAVLASFPDQALLTSAGVDEVAVLAAVAAESARSCPGAFTVEIGSGAAARISAPRLGWALDDGD